MNLLVLDATDKTIEMVMSGAANSTNPDWTSHYADAAAGAFTEGNDNGTLNGTTPVTIVDSPATGARRTIREITLYNADDAAVVVTLQYNDNGSIRKIVDIALDVGESWDLSSAAVFGSVSIGGGSVFIPFGPYQNSNPLSANPSYPYAASIDRTFSFVQWGQSWFVSTTNNGSHYWTISLRRPGGTILNSFNTAAGSPSTWTANIDATFAEPNVDAADGILYIQCDKTGSPGNLYVACPLLEVEI